MPNLQQQPPSPEAAAVPDLESGIADVFARLREAVAGGGDAAPVAAPADDGTTFMLLGELDRLWRGEA